MNSYEIIKQLGSGSFGRVLQVKSINQGSTLAMKQVKLLHLNQRQKDNALNQVRLLASIDSPSIISYKTAFFQQHQNILCIIMEYADGGDLSGIIKKKRQKGQKIPEQFIWNVAFQLMQGLKVLHQNKIIHRDIKPANIFFAEGHAKIGDLNVSKVMEEKFAVTQTGTPYYTAPQIWNNQKYDGRVDVWSLGCVLYELGSKKPPFTAKDLPGLAKKITNGFYDSLPFPYSKKLNEFIKKCLTVKMNQRPTIHQLFKQSSFEQMRSSQYDGNVQLLQTIKCPKYLKNLGSKLPESRSQKLIEAKSSKNLKSLKLIELQQKQNKNSKSLKKIGSVKHLHVNSPRKNNHTQLESSISSVQKTKLHHENHKNVKSQKKALQVVFESPGGYLKLPKIN